MFEQGVLKGETMLSGDKILEAITHCQSGSSSRQLCASWYCRICPYVNFGNICKKILRNDVIKFMNRVIEEEKNND